MVEKFKNMAKEQNHIGIMGFGLDRDGLFRGIYNLPDGMSAHQRLALRSKHLHDLATGLEQAIDKGLPPELLYIYSWAIDTISAEIKVISDRLEIQGKCNQQKF